MNIIKISLISLSLSILFTLNTFAQNFPYDSFTGHTANVPGVSFSTDRQIFASGSWDNTAQVWEVKTGNRLRRINNSFTETDYRSVEWNRYSGSVYDVALDVDGQTLAVCGDTFSAISKWSWNEDYYATLSVWEVSTGKKLWHIRADQDRTSNVSFSPDGQILASCGDENLIDFWDPKTGRHLRTLTGHEDDVQSISFSSDSVLMASCSKDKTVRVWEVNKGRHLYTLTGHTTVVNDVSFSSDGQILASCSEDGNIHIYDVHTGSLRHSFTKDKEEIAEESVRSVSFGSNGQILASGGGDGHVHLWEVSTGKHLYTLTGHTDYISRILFSPDGQTLAAGYSDGAVQLWQLPATHVRIIPDAFVSPDVGGQFTVDINIVDGQNVMGYEVSMKFDGTAFRFVKSDNGNFLPSPPNVFYVTPVISIEEDNLLTNTVTLKSTTVTLAATSLDEQRNGDGTLATVIFEVLDTKGSFIDLFDVTLMDSKGKYLYSLAHGSKIDPFILGDINGDGQVNIQDLVLISISFGQSVSEEENLADVNNDGIINIIDLVIVAGEFGNTAAAPTALAHAKEYDLTKADVQKWITQAQQLNLTDQTLQQGIHFLQQLLAALTPTETALLPNYPNPFNPETWIPYQLTKTADVSIYIYTTDGKLVRTITLGHQVAGIYQNRNSAAYWDGKNKLGEPVASGMYFYTLTAADFTATRKMLILK